MFPKFISDKPKVSAIGFAFLLWLYVSLNNNFTSEIQFNLNPVNVPADKMVLTDLPDKINVSITGKGVDLLWLNMFWGSDLNFNLDLSNMDGTIQYDLRDRQYLSFVDMPLNFENEIVVEEILSPDSLTVDLEKKVVKNIALSSDSIRIELEDGYTMVGGINFENETVNVTGPASLINSITAIQTQNTEFTGKSYDFSETVQLDLPHYLSVAEVQEEIKFSVDIQKIGEIEVVNIPVRLNNNYGNIDILPSGVNVTITGGVDHIVNLDAKDFTAIVNYSNEWKRGGEYISEIELSVPEDIVSYRISPQNVKVIVK